MNGQVRVLLVEDNPALAGLIEDMLAQAEGTEFFIANALSLAEALTRLHDGSADLVLLDLLLPDSQRLDSLTRVADHAPNVPIVVLTAVEDEQLALAALRQGAQDYLIKTEINPRNLIRAALYAVERKRHQVERERLIGQLQEAVATVKTLRGLLPICASCKKIRDDKGYWTQVEVYVMAHTPAEFTHGICPECEKQYRDRIATNL